MLLSELIEQFDMEVSQDGASHMTSNVDAYRISKRKWIIFTLNSILKRYAHLNPSFYETIIELPIEEESPTIDVPFPFIKLLGIKEGSYPFEKIYAAINDNNVNVTYVSDYKNRIKKVYSNFMGGQSVFLHGYFFPEQVIDNDDQNIDFPNQFDRLIVLSLVVAHNSKTKTDNNFQYSEYKQLLNEFQRANSVTQTVAVQESMISVSSRR